MSQPIGPKVIVRLAVSLDGYATGPNVSMDEPMGIGGEQLHEWMFNGTRQPEPPNVAAAVIGRRMYDIGVPHWGGDTPFPAPTFVVTHRPESKRQMKTNAFTFVIGGVERAVADACAAAGSGVVLVMSPSVAQQALAASLVDEIQVQLVPLLLGGGIRLFEHLGSGQIALDQTAVHEAPGVTHFTYRIRK